MKKLDDTYNCAQKNLRTENQKQCVISVTHTSLLLGNIQFGILTNVHRLLVIEKLSIWNCAFYTCTIDYRLKEIPNGINYFIKILKEVEHLDVPPDKNNEVEMNRRNF